MNDLIYFGYFFNIYIYYKNEFTWSTTIPNDRNV